jgi:kinesin family protein 5
MCLSIPVDKEARRRLWGGDHDNDPWKDAAVVPIVKNEALLGKLSSRQPLADTNAPTASEQACSETAEHLPNSITTGVLAVRPETQDMLLCAPGAGLKRFRFDSVFDDKSHQPAVYDKLAAPVVSEFLNGVSGTVFAYGQTGSGRVVYRGCKRALVLFGSSGHWCSFDLLVLFVTGKTFTMYGPDAVSGSQVTDISSSTGIVPRALAEAIGAVQQRRRHGIGGTLRLTVVEVYGNEVNNLLDDGATVGAWHGVAVRAVLQDTLGVGRFHMLHKASSWLVAYTPFAEVKDMAGAEQLLQRAEENKRQAATAMNERSSRAHTLTFLSLVQQRGTVALRSLLCLADLGGSEQIKKSKVRFHAGCISL